MKVAFLVADMAHDEELDFPKYWLDWEGAETTLAVLKPEHDSRFGRAIRCQATIEKLNPGDYDCVIIPSGYCPDKLRTSAPVLSLVKRMMASGKVVAAICHGAQVLISAEVAKGRKLTCAETVRDDVVNAGAIYEDRALVQDENLITARGPTDLPPFTSSIIDVLERTLSSTRIQV